MPVYKALSNGTLADPYRFIEKGGEIDLNKKEVEIYRNSKWLRPKAEVDGMIEPPLMGCINVTGTNGIQAMNALNAIPPSPATQQYNDQMAVILRKEAMEDAAAERIAAQVAAGIKPETDNQTPGGETGKGTGNQEVI